LRLCLRPRSLTPQLKASTWSPERPSYGETPQIGALQRFGARTYSCMGLPCSGAPVFAGARARVPVSALYGVRGSFGATQRIWRHPRHCPKLALRSRGRTKMAAPKQAREAVTPKAGLYIASIAAAGLALLTLGLSHWQSSGTARFAAFFFLAAAASTQKIRLPRMRGTMSLSFLFILIGIANFSF